MECVHNVCCTAHLYYFCCLYLYNVHIYECTFIYFYNIGAKLKIILIICCWGKKIYISIHPWVSIDFILFPVDLVFVLLFFGGGGGVALAQVRFGYFTNSNPVNLGCRWIHPEIFIIVCDCFFVHRYRFI